MSRHTPEPITKSLDELVPQYAEQKSVLDELDGEVKALNSAIKDALTAENKDSHTAGGYTAKMSTQVRETMNEDLLLEVLKKHGINCVIRTKEYVDMELLESYLYNNEVDKQLITDMDKCKQTKEVVQLRISKVKEKKNE